MSISIRQYWRGAINRIPYVQSMRTKLRYYERFCPLDHFYSPFPHVEDLKEREDVVFGPPPETLLDIDLNTSGQRSILDDFAQFYGEFSFPEEPSGNLRYYWSNPFFGLFDGILLYSFLRLLEPRRIIEVGSGMSSCLILDTVDEFLDSNVECVFIDPDPRSLLVRAHERDLERCQLLKRRVQEIDPSFFKSLEAGDILFIDSSHAVKTGSDVNFLIFEVLPRLAKGTYIHFHDIFYPFEYPKEWIYDGRSWNEAYLVRAFLQNNNRYAIVCFASYLEKIARDALESTLPRCLSSDGQSLWLRKL